MAKKPLEIDMIAGSQLRDTQGEVLSVDGADISDLEAGKGRLNDNHGKGFFNAIGRVTKAKKIFKAEDCDDDRQKYYWDKVKAPFIYVKGQLYDDEDHPNAKAAAAILRNIHKTDCPLQLKASVEGGVVARGVKDNSLLARTKIHSVALTFTPANNNTLVEPVSLDKSHIDEEADMMLIKSVMHLAETNVPSFRHIARDASANKIHQNFKQISELMKQMGYNDEFSIPSKNEIIEQALEQKIADNIAAINESIKELTLIKGDIVDINKRIKQKQESDPNRIQEKRNKRAMNRKGKDPLHQPVGHRPFDRGVSEVGDTVRYYKIHPEEREFDRSYHGGAYEQHRRVLENLKNQQKPKLTKGDDIDDLAKAKMNWKQAAAASAIAAGMGLAHDADAKQLSAKPAKQISQPMKQKYNFSSPSFDLTRVPASHQAAFEDLQEKHPHLATIASIESSGAKNYNHETITNPESIHYGHTAGGMFGMMPQSVKFILRNDKELSKHHPELSKMAADIDSNHEKITNAINNDPKLAIELANSYFNRNKQKTLNDEMLFHSWNSGLKGTWKKYKNKGMNEIKKNPYVKKAIKILKEQQNQDLRPANEIKKALMSGYGGGSPLSSTGGQVLQSESLEGNIPGFKYISCNKCGKEQIYSKFQVKCRECGQHFGMDQLYSVMVPNKKK